MPPCAATVWLRVGNTLRDAGGLQPFERRAERRAQTGAAGADDDDVVVVIDDRIGGRHCRAPTQRVRASGPNAA